MNKLMRTGMMNAAWTGVYVAGVGIFMYFSAMSKVGQRNSILIPIALLLLFVLSAAVTGFLIFGKPAEMYVDGKKKEAVKLLGYTLGFFAAITLLFLSGLIAFTR